MEHFDLAVIGSGSGNVVIPEYRDGRKAALIELGSFGGTCVNRGCIPSKMFVYTADVAMQVRRASQFGIGAAVDSVHWSAIRDRIMARVKETSDTGCKDRVESAHVTLFEGHARFAGPHELVINDDVRIEADQIVIAAGGRPSVPEVVTNSGIDFHTSDTIMWLDALPASMVILGGGYVAAGSGGRRPRRQRSTGGLPQPLYARVASSSVDGLGLTAMISEDALPGIGHGLSAVADVKLGVQVA